MDENKENIVNPETEVTETETQTEMTPEQWTAEMAKLIAENKRLKAATDKATAEASNWKKKYTATQSDAERLSMEKAEQEAQRQQEFEELKKFKAVTEASDRFRAIGYSDERAKAAAEAQFAGDVEELMSIQKAHQDDLEKRIKANLMKTMPAPTTGNDDTVQVTKEQLLNMSYRDQLDFKMKHPAVYQNLMK